MDDILTADTRHFFIQARGSLAEVIEHLEVALDEKYISEEVYRELNLFVMKSLGLSMDTSNRLTRKRTNFEASQSLIPNPIRSYTPHRLSSQTSPFPLPGYHLPGRRRQR